MCVRGKIVMKTLYVSGFIDFRCAACGELIHVPESDAGTVANCPQCNEPHRVPKHSGTSKAKSQSDTPKPDKMLIVPPRPKKRRPARIPSAGSWSSGVLGVLGIMGSFFMGFGLFGEAKTVIILLVLFAVSWTAFLTACIMCAIERGSIHIAASMPWALCPDAQKQPKSDS